MKRAFRLIIAACLVSEACASPPITRNQIPGDYVYRSLDPESRLSDHEWDRITLSPDGSYRFVEGGPTRSKTERAGRWQFQADPPEIDLDHSGYPVQIRSHTVRLVVNDDVGTWYEKSEKVK